MNNSENLVCITDDHNLVTESLSNIINKFEGFTVSMTASNGKELITKLNSSTMLPNILLLDVNMPVMNGMETLVEVRENFPSIRVLALSMEDDETTVLTMIKNGAKGYLLKDTNLNILKSALDTVAMNDFFHTDIVSQVITQSIQMDDEVKTEKKVLNDREETFLQFCSTDYTYKEIADIMCLSPKTIDGYRDNLFKRFDVKSRTGLVIYALKNELISLE